MQVSSLILQTVWGSFDACIEPLFYWKINLSFFVIGFEVVSVKTRAAPPVNSCLQQ